jgi:mono/diheme cytochrome c family protein
MTRWTILLVVVLCLAGTSAGRAEDPNVTRKDLPEAAERGRKALLGRTYIPATITLNAYDNAWRQWGLKEKPADADYDKLLRERYGLHEAPYPNGRYPMGLREANLVFPLGTGKALTQDCLVCHGGSIAGQSYVGLGNTSLDYQALHEELAGDGRRTKTPFRFSNVRGTSEAGGFAVFLLGFREPNLELRDKRLDLDLHDDMCEDVPAWWLLKKKKTMYYTGGSDTRSVRSIMQFMMSPLNMPDAFASAEADFADIREFLLTLEPPKYPLSIDKELASKGEELFKANCSRCHGTYGEKWTYPNKFIPIDEIGTDRRRYDGITKKFGDYYNKSWFAEKYKILEHDGYQAPPLDGIWATAPYLHNGSVPTVYHVLNSKARPKVFTRSYRTDLEAYDAKKLGWKVEVLDKPPDPAKVSPFELRKVYDTTQPGRGNGGHTFGDRLSEDERMAVIEYLKTL